MKQPSSWFHVADLYGDVNDVDSVREIVSRLTECKDFTKKAIESETKSDWSKAFQYYRYGYCLIYLFLQITTFFFQIKIVKRWVATLHRQPK